MAKIFERLSLEALEENGANNQNQEDQDPADQTLNEADGSEADEAKNEIENDVSKIEDGEESLALLEEEVMKIDQALGEEAPQGGADETINEANQTATDENGNVESTASDNIQSGQDIVNQDASTAAPAAEPVDAATAAVVAQEALRHIGKNLGLDTSSVAISHESIKNSPITSLRLTRESIGEVIEKVIRAIREFFQKIWAKLKIYAAKIVSYFSNYTKQVANLKKAVESASENANGTRLGSKIESGAAEVYARRAMCSKPGSDMFKVCQNLVAIMKNNKKAADQAANGIGGILGKLTGIKFLGIGKLFSAGGELVGAIKRMEETHFNEKDVAKYYDVPQGTPANVSLLRFNGSALYTEDTTDESAKVFTGGSRVRKITLALKGDTIRTITEGLKNYLTKKEALSILSELENIAKSTQADNANIIKQYENVMKQNEAKMNEISKAVSGNKIKEQDGKAQLTALRQINLVTAITLPELLFDRIDNFRNVLFLVAQSTRGVKAAS